MCLIMMSGHVLNIEVSEQTAFGLEWRREEPEAKGAATSEQSRTSMSPAVHTVSITLVQFG
jgi:hypothetical protein